MNRILILIIYIVILLLHQETTLVKELLLIQMVISMTVTLLLDAEREHLVFIHTIIRSIPMEKLKIHIRVLGRIILNMELEDKPTLVLESTMGIGKMDRDVVKEL